MADHTHTTLVDGCYRCELNRDEDACVTCGCAGASHGICAPFACEDCEDCAAYA